MSVKLSITKGGDGASTITGYDSYELKEVIKSCGGKWAPLTKSWVVMEGKDLTPLLSAIAELKAKRSSEGAGEGLSYREGEERGLLVDLL